MNHPHASYVPCLRQIICRQELFCLYMVQHCKWKPKTLSQLDELVLIEIFAEEVEVEESPLPLKLFTISLCQKMSVF